MTVEMIDTEEQYGPAACANCLATIEKNITSSGNRTGRENTAGSSWAPVRRPGRLPVVGVTVPVVGVAVR
jgi:hypothetical protein